MKKLPGLFSVGLLIGLPSPQGRAETPGFAPVQLARKAKAQRVDPKVLEKIDEHLGRAAKLILRRQPVPAMREAKLALKLDPGNKRARAYKLVLGEVLEARKPSPRPIPPANPKQLNGTRGNWRACRGTGAHVCAEKIPSGYGRYWRNHPQCIPNKSCEGRYFTCNEACPPPGEVDRD